ncbi:MAG: beta-propeller fold lactonase family protein [candidate division Zixibacteria bacterium]|nr:beta-propeller fold lactonase family protein [candidate division Zixibacteria bacterium]
MRICVIVATKMHLAFVQAIRWIGCQLAIAMLLIAFMAVPLLGQTVVGTITRPGMLPYYLAVYEGGNKLFVGDADTDHLLIYDGHSFDLLAEFAIEGGVGPMVVDEASGKLYMGTGCTAAVVDAVADTLIRYIDLQGSPQSFAGLASDSSLGKVYVLYTDAFYEPLHVIDVATDSVTQVPLAGFGLRVALAVNPVTHEIFITNLHRDTLDIVDGQTLATARVPATRGWSVVANWLKNKIYIQTATWRGVFVYDRDTGDTTVVGDGNDATLLFFDPGGNRVYTSSEGNQLSTIIEGHSDAYFHLPMHAATSDLSFRYSTNHVYYVGGDFIAVLDDSTQFLEHIPIDNPNPSSAYARAIEINQSTGRVYVVNDAATLNCITVVQDTDMMIRPPVFLGNPGDFRIDVLDPVSKVVVALFSSAYPEHGMAVRPGGGRVYEATYQKFSYLGALWIYAGCGPQALLTSFETGGNDPTVPAVTPDGTRIYVTNSASNDVSVIDVETNDVVTIIPVGQTPWGIAVSPDGSKVYVANKNDNTLFTINTVSNTVIDTIPVGSNPWGIAINPSGTKAYVANSGSGTVSVLDIASQTIIGTVTVGSSPHWLTFTPDGRHVYVSNTGSGSVSIIEAGIDTVIQTVIVGNDPEGIIVLPDGSEVYVGTDSTVSVINTSDYSVTTIFLDPPVPFWRNKIVPIAVADPTSRFAGRVTTGGVPLDSVLVRALQEGVEEARAITNASGDYCVFNLKSGTYDIEVSAEGYVPQALASVGVSVGRTTILNFSLSSTSVPTDEDVTRKFELGQNFPNPFNASTTISYELPRKSFVILTIYNLLGQEIETLVNDERAPGKHQVQWDAKNFASGIYFYRLKAGDFCEVNRMVLLR